MVGWVCRLLTAELASKYQLTNLVPVSNMSFNYVVSGLQNEKPIIIKLGLDEKALSQEAACLQSLAQTWCS